MAKTRRSKSNKANLRAADLFDLAPTKSQLQQIKIIEAAIKSFAKHGLEKTTYTNLAKECEISRPLIHHYFPTLEELFSLAAKYVRKTLLRCATDEMAKASKTPSDQLRAYIRGCFEWVTDYPDQNSFWLLYFYQASLGGTAREENSALVKAGHQRIEEIIKAGIESKSWKSENPKEDAKSIQMTLTGALVSCMTEDGYLSTIKAQVFTETVALDKILGMKSR